LFYFPLHLLSGRVNNTYGGVTLKVKLLPKVSSYYFNGIDYKPGSIFDIKPCQYRADFMLALEVSEAEAAVADREPTLAPVPTAEKPIEAKPAAKKKTRKTTKKKTQTVTSVKEAVPEPPATEEKEEETSVTELKSGSEAEAS